MFNILKTLDGIHAIGHVRYATSGGGGFENVHPFLFRHYSGDFALAHNGNLVNSHEIKYFLESQGSIFQSTLDSEILAHLIKKDKYIARIEAIKEALRVIVGGFAFITMTANKMYGCRDKHGLHPLSFARLKEGYVIASETCAFDMIGAEFIRDLEPVKILCISEKEIESCKYSEACSHHICAMEYIYFSRPDSVIEGLNVKIFRKKIILCAYCRCGYCDRCS
ncbi:MAG: amidophosphoribosyltransferase [Chitinophagaceae bacterium]